MKKSLDGIFTMLRKIYQEQKKQTKILQAIESSKEQSKAKNYMELNSVVKSVTDKPKGSMKIPLNI